MIEINLINSTTNEIWRPVVGYEGLYEISNFGRVKSFVKYPNKPAILRPLKNQTNHLKVVLAKNKKQKKLFIHRLMLLTFIGAPPCENAHARHLDGDPLNNSLFNLRWGTPKENVLDRWTHGTMGIGEKSNGSKLKPSDVLEIKILIAKGCNNSEIARKYRVNPSSIWMIKNKKTWKHV